MTDRGEEVAGFAGDHLDIGLGPYSTRQDILWVGHHARPECLSRPGEWCRAIGQHPGVCAKCPLRGARDA